MNDLGFKGNVPGAWRVPPEFTLTDHVSVANIISIIPGFAEFIPDALSIEDCSMLIELFKKQEHVPVAVSGYRTANLNDFGSVRATGWGPELGKQLWNKMSNKVCHALGDRVKMHDFKPTDWFRTPNRKEHLIWKPTGISPVLRFMEYGKGGRHNTHYDMGFDYEAHDPNDHRRTLMSVVWYLNEEPGMGGCTRFIDDNQLNLPIQLRNLDDWERSANDDEVICFTSPRRGGALIFWHRMAHDVEEFKGNSRIIIRGDIEFSVC